MNLKKSILAVLLVASMTVSLAACGGGGSSSGSTDESSSKTESSSTAEGSSTPEDDIMTPYGKYPETITMTTAKRASAAPNFVEGESAENNAMTKYVKDKINVEMKIDWEVESAEFPNKLALMITANTLPDMFTLTSNDYLLYKQLVENELLADLQPGYDACGGEYMKTAFATYEGRNLAPFQEDGKLYALAGGRYGHEHNQLWLRQDWMDEYGLETPKTIDDIEKILTTFKEKNPGGNYAGMSLNSKKVGGVYDGSSASPIFASFGAYPGAWIKDKDGNIIWGSTAPEVKEGLKVLADWYKKGLIDKQFATRTAAGATDALFSGSQSGAVFAPWWYVYTIGDMMKTTPEANPLPTNAPLDADGKYNVMWPGPAGDYIMVNKNYAHPEAIYKIINCEFDMWREFDEEAGKLIAPNRAANVDWGYMFPTSGFNIEPSNCISNIGAVCTQYFEHGNFDGFENESKMNKDMAIRAKDWEDTKVLNGTNWIDYTGRYIASNMMTTPEVVDLYPEFSFTTDAMADLKPNLDTLEDTTFLKIVTGEQPIDAFDKFVEDWYKQGGQTMTDEVIELAK